MVIIITSKQCIKCHKTKKVSNYYIHRDNRKGHGIDNTCKECSRQMGDTLEGLKEYCDLNSRVFNSALYTISTESVMKKYENDVEFNSLSEEKRESFLNVKIKNAYFSQQSQSQYYSFIENDESLTLIEQDTIEDVEENEGDLEPIKKNKEKKIYSQDWQGSYTKAQILWLDTYYFDTCNDFVVSNRNHKDYVRKIAKASLAMDEAYNDMMNGVAGADKRYDKNRSIFDGLSQSAKLSEKTRSTTDVVGLGSLSEIVAQLEQTGFLQKKMTFEKDDIDKIGDDFRWTLTSVGGEL